MPDNSSIDLYLVIKKKWWLIALCAVIVSGLLFFKQYTKKVQYEAYALLTIRSRNFQTSYLNPEMAFAYLNSDSATEEISKNLGFGKKGGVGAIKKIDVMPVGDFLKINVTDTDPDRARKIANAAGDVLMKKAYYVTKNKLQLLEKRVGVIDGNLKENDEQGKKISENISESLTSSNMTANERAMLSAWQAQILSMSDNRNAQLQREKLELGLQINNIKEGAPQITKALYPERKSKGIKSAVAMGILVGGFMGIIVSVWLEFWQPKKA